MGKRYATLWGTIALTAAAAFAHPVFAADYDRKLERDVQQLVAARIGELRGSLQDEWKPNASTVIATADGSIGSSFVSPVFMRDAADDLAQPDKPAASFVDLSALPEPAAAGFITAGAIVGPHSQAPHRPMLGPPAPLRKVRIIEIDRIPTT